MSFSVYWTPEAELTLNENIVYLSENWNLTSIHEFLDRIDEVINHIQNNPDIYPLFRKKDQIHKCVLNKHITLYFRIVSKSRIDLLTFWNTHQNPSNLEL